METNHQLMGVRIVFVIFKKTNTIKVYKEEKELREKRLAAYAETIREKIEMYCGHKTELFLDNLCDQESDNLRDHKQYILEH